MNSKEHHIWCNFFMHPRENCKMCEGLYRDYPLRDGEIGVELMKRHFPNNVVVKGGGEST